MNTFFEHRKVASKFRIHYPPSCGCWSWYASTRIGQNLRDKALFDLALPLVRGGLGRFRLDEIAWRFTYICWNIPSYLYADTRTNRRWSCLIVSPQCNAGD